MSSASDREKPIYDRPFCPHGVAIVPVSERHKGHLRLSKAHNIQLQCHQHITCNNHLREISIYCRSLVADWLNRDVNIPFGTFYMRISDRSPASPPAINLRSAVISPKGQYFRHPGCRMSSADTSIVCCSL